MFLGLLLKDDRIFQNFNAICRKVLIQVIWFVTQFLNGEQIRDQRNYI